MKVINREEFESTVFSFINKRNGISLEEFNNIENFATSGIIDSVAMIELVLFLEENYGEITGDFEFDAVKLGTTNGLYGLFK